MKLQALQLVNHPAALAPNARYFPCGGFQPYVQFNNMNDGAGNIPTPLTGSGTISIRDSGGTALVSYSFSFSAHLDTVNHKYVVDSSSSSYSGSASIYTEPNSVDTSSATQPSYESFTARQVNSTALSAGNNLFGISAHLFLLVVPVGATITLDTYTLSAALVGSIFVGGKPANRPVAAFTKTFTDPHVDVDGSTSSVSANRDSGTVPVTDTDASITYDWGWGDGTTHGTGTTDSHDYDSDGAQPITLTVTDNYGGSDSTTQSVTVANGYTQIGLAQDAAGNVYSAVPDGTGIRIKQWTRSMGSHEDRALVSNAKRPTLSIDRKTGLLYLGTQDRTSGVTTGRVSNDGGRAVA